MTDVFKRGRIATIGRAAPHPAAADTLPPIAELFKMVAMMIFGFAD